MPKKRRKKITLFATAIYCISQKNQLSQATCSLTYDEYHISSKGIMKYDGLGKHIHQYKCKNSSINNKEPAYGKILSFHSPENLTNTTICKF